MNGDERGAVRHAGIADVVLTTAIVLCDVLLLAGSGWVVAVLLSGGWEWYTPVGHLRAYTASSVIYAMVCLGVVRAAGIVRCPRFLGVVDLRRVRTRVEQGSEKWISAVERLDQRTVWRVLAIMVVLSSFGKILNAGYYDGFCCGDDVEIHEMTFARLFGLDWPVWNIRSAVYPLGVIYPVQAAAVYFGVSAPETLILLGRLVVVAFSAVSLVLTYGYAKRVFGLQSVALGAAAVLSVNKLFSAYGSSELPGAVAAACLLGSAWCLRGASLGAFVLAAALMGAAASLRFSELAFVAAAMVSLAASRQFLRGLVFGGLAFVFFLAFIGAADQLYWGEPFASLRHIVDYTLVHRLSSRGFQPFHYYLSSATHWADWILVAFIAYGATRAPLSVSAWFFVPLILLSALPHKEERYLVPAMPFAAILAGLGYQRLLERSRKPALRPGASTWRVWVTLALALAVVLELDGFRFRRSEAAVHGARLIAALGPARVVALEESWRAGGRLYLRETRAVLDIEPDAVTTAERLEQFLTSSGADSVGLTQKTLADPRHGALLQRLGFRELEAKSPPAPYRVFTRAPIRSPARSPQ